MSDFQFAAKNLEMGQLNALVKKLGGEDVVYGILADRVRFAITEKELLAPRGPATVGPVAANPHEFLKTRPGLWISQGFKERVLSVVGDSVSLDEKISLPSYTLTEHANDTTIRKNLPEGHVFVADELCAILKHLLENQPNGKEGHLLSNGYANLFYVKEKGGEVCVVFVRWCSDRQEWCVGAWVLDGSTWHSVRRVFSRNC